MLLQSVPTLFLLLNIVSVAGQGCQPFISYKGSQVSKYSPLDINLENERTPEFTCTANNCGSGTYLTWNLESVNRNRSTSTSRNNCNGNNTLCTIKSTFRPRISTPDSSGDDRQSLYCYAYNRSTYIQLNLIYKPLMEIEPKPSTDGKITVYEGQPSWPTITCRTKQANPTVTSCLWFKDGAFYEKASDLSFNEGSRDDKGSYSCIGTNSVGNSSRVSFSLDVQYAAIVSDLRNLSVVEYERAYVQCKVTPGNPPPNIYWTRGTYSMTFSSNQVIDISSTDRTYAGNYICHAKTIFTPTGGVDVTQDVTKNMEINVYYPPDITLTGSKVYDENTNVSLYCTARGNPNNITFLPWQQKVESTIWNWSGEVQASGVNVLKFVNVNYSNYGAYTCLATNGIRDRYGVTIMKERTKVVIATRPHKIGNGRVSRQSQGSGDLSVHVFSFYYTPTVSWIRLPGTSLHIDKGMDTFQHAFSFYGRMINWKTYRSTITVDNVSLQETTTFVAVVKNGMDQTVFMLEVPADPTPEQISGGTVASICLALLLVVCIVALFRKQIAAKLRSKNSTSVPPSREDLDVVHNRNYTETGTAHGGSDKDKGNKGESHQQNPARVNTNFETIKRNPNYCNVKSSGGFFMVPKGKKKGEKKSLPPVMSGGSTEKKSKSKKGQETEDDTYLNMEVRKDVHKDYENEIFPKRRGK